MQVYDQVSRTLILEIYVGTCRVQAIDLQRSVWELAFVASGRTCCFGHRQSSFLVGAVVRSPAFSVSPARSLKIAVSCCSQISC